MRKLLFFTTFAALLVLGCSSNDDMPCLSCSEPFPYQGGGYYPQPPQNSYAYCLVYYGYYECSYMSVSDCSYEGGDTYSDNTCGGYWWLGQSTPSSSSSSVEYTGGSCNVSDYGTVQIGDQVWMAKNWGCYAAGSKCYNNDPAHCNKYGRLYDWATAMGIDERYNYEYWGGSDVNHKGICPSGWHIPNNGDWSELVNYVESYWGCSSCAARYLKSQSDWYGEDTFGFAALPGGYGYSNDFRNVGNSGHWWSASEDDANYYAYYAYYWLMLYGSENASWSNNGKSLLQSVRCLQD